MDSAALIISGDEIVRWIAQFFWPFCRIGAFFLLVPIIGTQLVPARIRLALAIAISLVVAPMISEVPTHSPLSPDGIVLVAQELLIGFMMGFMVQVLFQICVIGGQLIAMQNGLGFATLIDPVNGINVAAIAQLYLMSSNLIFLAFNGHIWLIKTLSGSFTTLPISLGIFEFQTLYDLMKIGNWLFASGLIVALPAVTSILLVNLSFGVITKVAPQMNIFAIGFPLVMVLGLVIIWIGLVGFLPQFQQFTEENFFMITEFLSSHK